MSAVIGGLMGNLLLLPGNVINSSLRRLFAHTRSGLSMICGGIKFRNQKFNRVSAGVSSVLLLISIVGTREYLLSTFLVNENV